MKNLFTIHHKMLAGGLLIAISTLFSCKKLIEIPANPPSQITRAEQFKDSTTTISAVVGVYTYAGGQGFGYNDANFTLSTSLSAHEISPGVKDQAEFYSFTLNQLNSQVVALWQSPFQGMYQINDVLNGITNNANLSPSFVKQITGEMEVTRAFYYFNLVNLFGGVPLVTSINYKATANLPRASSAAVYTQILTDLNDAVKKLPASYSSDGRARPNLYAAQALLAKVHLYQGKWQAAYNEADSIIRSGNYSLNSDLNSVFLDGSNEAIWQLPNSNTFQGTAEAGAFIPNDSSEAPTYIITDSLLNQFEPGDKRLQTWINTVNINGQNLSYPYKYKDKVPTTPATDYMIFRLGEIYLIRAEAAAELNNLGVALADVNTIRARAGLGPITNNTTSQAAVLAAIARERRTELCFEWGNRWFDLIRTGKAGAFLPGYQGYDAMYPLPQAQLILNSTLVQNPGYN
ncbi:RagB/SusD family nutrient uptake outer membrane protein [Pedobacter sp. L105]|uniref:RagB/SusD family nutrient uptake outer membrane protein n=1 Tax=Pedobacter sp. L105 TaxID=1641871 RepID=UPI00131AAD59|nr:RagB/SusD family nutrient uptake outer membrane protein [Pedobacter sp. L105]